MVTVVAAPESVAASAAAPEVVVAAMAEPGAAPGVIGPAPAPRAGQSQAQGQGGEGRPGLYRGHIVYRGEEQELHHIPHGVFCMSVGQMMERAAVVYDLVSQNVELFRVHAADVSVGHVGLFDVGHNPVVQFRMPVMVMCAGLMMRVMFPGMMMRVMSPGMMMRMMPAGMVMWMMSAGMMMWMMPAGMMMRVMSLDMIGMMLLGVVVLFRGVMLFAHMYTSTPFLWDAPVYGMRLSFVSRCTKSAGMFCRGGTVRFHA